MSELSCGLCNKPFFDQGTETLPPGYTVKGGASYYHVECVWKEIERLQAMRAGADERMARQRGQIELLLKEIERLREKVKTLQWMIAIGQKFVWAWNEYHKLEDSSDGQGKTA